MIQDTEPKCDECGHILPLAGPCANCGTRPGGFPIYVAGAYADRERVRQCMRAARDRNLHVVHDWVEIIDGVRADGGAHDCDVPDDEAREHALVDVEAIQEAKALWLLAPPRGRGWGCKAELGIAYGLGVPIVVSGETARDSVFTALGMRADTDKAALDVLAFWADWPDPVPYEDATGDTQEQPAESVSVTARVRSVTRPAPHVPDPPEHEQCDEDGCTSVATHCERHAQQPAEPDADGNTYPAPGVWANPARKSGEHCVEGTRIPTWMIAGRYAAGETVLDLLADYPGLGEDRDKVEAALRYELKRMYETYEPEGEDPDDEPDTTVDQQAAWRASIRGRVEQVEETGRIHDQTFSAILDRLLTVERGRRAGRAVLKPWHNTPRHDCGEPLAPIVPVLSWPDEDAEAPSMEHVRCAACGEQWREGDTARLARIWWSAGAWAARWWTECEQHAEFPEVRHG